MQTALPHLNGQNLISTIWIFSSCESAQKEPFHVGQLVRRLAQRPCPAIASIPPQDSQALRTVLEQRRRQLLHVAFPQESGRMTPMSFPSVTEQIF